MSDEQVCEDGPFSTGGAADGQPARVEISDILDALAGVPAREVRITLFDHWSAEVNEEWGYDVWVSELGRIECEDLPDIIYTGFHEREHTALLSAYNGVERTLIEKCYHLESAERSGGIIHALYRTRPDDPTRGGAKAGQDSCEAPVGEDH